jgi:hypothetical protein
MPQTLVVNMLMAPVLLSERLSRLDVIATTIIVVGTVISVAFGSKESADHTISECTCRACVGLGGRRQPLLPPAGKCFSVCLVSHGRPPVPSHVVHVVAAAVRVCVNSARHGGGGGGGDGAKRRGGCNRCLSSALSLLCGTQ